MKTCAPWLGPSGQTSLDTARSLWRRRVGGFGFSQGRTCLLAHPVRRQYMSSGVELEVGHQNIVNREMCLPFSRTRFGIGQIRRKYPNLAQPSSHNSVRIRPSLGNKTPNWSSFPQGRPRPNVGRVRLNQPVSRQALIFFIFFAAHEGVELKDGCADHAWCALIECVCASMQYRR